MSELINSRFLRIAFVLFIAGAMVIPVAMGVWEGSNSPLPGTGIPESPTSGMRDHSNDGGPWTGAPSSGVSAADKMIASIKNTAAYKLSSEPASTAADKALENQGIVPIFESAFGKIYQREVHGVIIYSPDGTYFPIGYSAAYRNYFFYGSIDDFRKYVADNTWYTQVMCSYLLKHAEETPNEGNTRFANTGNLTNSSQVNKKYGGGYGDWFWLLK